SKRIGADDFRHRWNGGPEITIAIRKGRNRLKLVVDVLRFPELLEINEEERLVRSYRPAGGKAVIVPSGRRSCVRFVVFERVPRVENLVNEVVVYGSVELIGSGLHGDVENAATDLAVFRRIVARLNCNFLNRVDSRLRLRWDAGRARIRGFLAFDTE